MAYALISNIHNLFIWAPKNMKKLVGDVFLNYLQGSINCILKLPFIHTETWPKVESYVHKTSVPQLV
jgi:hypothetical protein